MLKLINHPLIQIKLTVMRSKDTSHKEFRSNLNEIASLMTYEILRDYKTKDKEVITPTNTKTVGKTLDSEIIIIPILRAGLGMEQGILDLIPQARVGHIGLYRDEKTFKPIKYLYKTPQEVSKEKSTVLLVDPMLATGNSANDAIDSLKEEG